MWTGFVESAKSLLQWKMRAVQVNLRKQDPGLDLVEEMVVFRCSVGRGTHFVHDSWRWLYFDLAHRSCRKTMMSPSNWKEYQGLKVADALFVWQVSLAYLHHQTLAHLPITWICCEA